MLTKINDVRVFTTLQTLPKINCSHISTTQLLGYKHCFFMHMETIIKMFEYS